MTSNFSQQSINDTRAQAFAFLLLLIIIFSIGYWSVKELKKISPSSIDTSMTDLNGKNIVFVIAFKDFRDEEYFVPKEILEKAGAKIITASNQTGTALGADGGEVEVDLLISQVYPANFDAVVFIGGSGCLENLDNENSYKVAQDAVFRGKVLASICISPTILAKAGVLKGKRATVWSSLLDKSAVKTLEANGAIYEDKMVVVDGKIVTGNGPDASAKFGQAIVGLLR